MLHIAPEIKSVYLIAEIFMKASLGDPTWIKRSSKDAKDKDKAPM